jgi:hypothetical protein
MREAYYFCTAAESINFTNTTEDILPDSAHEERKTDRRQFLKTGLVTDRTISHYRKRTIKKICMQEYPVYSLSFTYRIPSGSR